MVSPETLEEIISRQFGNASPQRANTADIESSLTDYLRLAAGQTIRDPEPLARSWIRGGLTLSEVRAEMNLTTSDFAEAMSGAGTSLLRASFASANADVAAISRVIEVPDYKSQAAASLAISEPVAVAEDEPLPDGEVTVTETDSGSGLVEYGMRLAFSRALFSSLGSSITEAVQGHGASFSLIEMRRIAELLEAETLTTSASSALDATGLGKVTAALRNATNESGALLNLPLAVVVVPPALEHACYVLRESSGRQFRVVANAFLTSSTTWFGFAPPALAAPVRRLVLRGASGPTLVMDSKRSLERGARFALTHSVGFRFAGTAGVVKCTA